jgi:hypothetical protein
VTSCPDTGIFRIAHLDDMFPNDQRRSGYAQDDGKVSRSKIFVKFGFRKTEQAGAGMRRRRSIPAKADL